MRNVSDKSYRENQNTFCVQIFFVFENLAVNEVMWKNVVQQGQATGDNMAHAHCMLDN